MPKDLLINFPGFLLQGKHLCVDGWKRLVKGRKPVSSEEQSHMQAKM
jgi:hypothetical protein